MGAQLAARKVAPAARRTILRSMTEHSLNDETRYHLLHRLADQSNGLQIEHAPNALH